MKIALLILLAASLGGCGRHAVASAPAPPALPVLRVGTSGDYLPFSSVSESGLPEGLDIDAAMRLGRDLGARVELVRFTWPDLDAALARGDFDIAMSGVTMRADRAIAGCYTRPYATVGAVALVRSASLSSLDALDRPSVRIAVNAGGHLERLARARFPSAAVQPVPDNRAVLQRLLDGQADAAVTDTAELSAWQRPGLTALGPFSADHKAYVLPAGRADLAARVDAWLAAREGDGWMNAERVRWLGPDASMDAAAASREAVAALIRLRLDLMPSVAAAKRAAGQPIDDPEQEQRVLARVGALSSRPRRAEEVYRQLIAMAKAVQRTSTASPSASLGDLRAAIARVDALLVRTLDETPPASVETWQATLGRTLAITGIDSVAIQRLSQVLSNT